MDERDYKAMNAELKNQTAVEWLVNVVQSCIAPNYIPKEIIKQALEMEKEQFINLHIEAMKEGLIVEGSQQWEAKYLPKIKLIAEKTWNKTFKK
jgi:hypothetical protein